MLFSDILEYNIIIKNCKTVYFAEYHALFHIHFLFSLFSIFFLKCGPLSFECLCVIKLQVNSPTVVQS